MSLLNHVHNGVCAILLYMMKKENLRKQWKKLILMIHPRAVTRHGDNNFCKKRGIKTFISNIVPFQFWIEHIRVFVQS